MAYPNNEEIIRAANTYTSTPQWVFGFAGHYGRVPGSAADLNAYITAVSSWAQQLGSWTAPADVLGYDAANGQLPQTFAQLGAWMQAGGFVDATGSRVGAPPPGYNYPPGGAATNPTSTPGTFTDPGPTAVGLTVPAPGRGLLGTVQADVAQAESSIQAHEKGLLIAGALGFGWYTGILPGLLRSLRGRR